MRIIYLHTFTSLIRKKSVGISVDNYMKKIKNVIFFGVVNNTYRFMHELG